MPKRRFIPSECCRGPIRPRALPAPAPSSKKLPCARRNPAMRRPPGAEEERLFSRSRLGARLPDVRGFSRPRPTRVMNRWKCWRHLGLCPPTPRATLMQDRSVLAISLRDGPATHPAKTAAPNRDAFASTRQPALYVNGRMVRLVSRVTGVCHGSPAYRGCRYRRPEKCLAYRATRVGAADGSRTPRSAPSPR